MWEPTWIDRMQTVGNQKANDVWEAKLEPYQKLTEHCLPHEREEFIKNKCIIITYILYIFSLTIVICV
jgi:hypothetical protein